MRHAALAALIVAALGSLVDERPQAGDRSRTLTVDGRQRSYRLHLPPPGRSGGALAVVLAFHGGATNADSMIRLTGLNDLADRAGFMVVYPNGTGRLNRMLTWNAGSCCGYASIQRVDDVAAVRAVLEDVGRLERSIGAWVRADRCGEPPSSSSCPVVWMTEPV